LILAIRASALAIGLSAPALICADASGVFCAPSAARTGDNFVRQAGLSHTHAGVIRPFNRNRSLNSLAEWQ
jgi:hypothetical protein